MAERHHHAKLVGNAPVFDHLAVLETAHVDHVDERLPARRRVPIMRGAAAVDSEIAALRARNQEHRFQNLLKFVTWVTANGPLRRDLSEEAAASIVWALTSPEMHPLLRVDRAWPAQRDAEWLAESLTLTLLP